MKFTIMPKGLSLQEPVLFTCNFKQKDIREYYEEVTQRFITMSRLKTEEERQVYTKENYVCDIDEVVEIGNMSVSTLQDFIKFITK